MKRRIFSAKFKAAAVRRMRAGESPSALAVELGVRRKSLYHWRDTTVDGNPLRPPGRPKKGPPDPARIASDTARRLEELERLVGQLTVENRFFKGALQRIKEIRQQQGKRGGTQSSPKSKR
jgi:transposase-like protein